MERLARPAKSVANDPNQAMPLVQLRSIPCDVLQIRRPRYCGGAEILLHGLGDEAWQREVSSPLCAQEPLRLLNSLMSHHDSILSKRLNQRTSAGAIEDSLPQADIASQHLERLTCHFSFGAQLRGVRM
jgi:hypothetical protein